jgi:hypothetical protein
LELAKQLFTLLVIAGLSSIEALSSAADDEQVRLMGPACVDQSFSHPVSLGNN